MKKEWSSGSWSVTVTLHGGCRRSPTFPRSCCAAGRRAGSPAPGAASQRARQKAPVHPAPQAQQGAQEDRVLP